MAGTTSSSILFIVGPALGHVGRLYEIARQLRQRINRDIIFVTPDSALFTSQVIGDEFEIIRLPTGLAEAPAITFADGLERLFADRRPAMIVLDIEPLKWLSAVRFPDCPRVMITNFFLTEFAAFETTQIKQFEGQLGPKVMRARRERGLPKLTTAYELYQADRVLLADPQDLSSGNDPLPENHIVVGPCCWSHDGDLPQPLDRLSEILLVSLGSTGGKKISSDTIETIKSWSQATVAVSVGVNPAQEPERIATDYCFSWVSVEKTLARSRLLISQGGAGSSYFGLSCGVPLIVMPEHDNHRILGEILEQHGLAVCLRTERSVDRIGTIDFAALAERATQFAARANANGAAILAAQKVAEIL